jgi:3-dehydroquinate dehydratase / shikimate dehydrogenase
MRGAMTHLCVPIFVHSLEQARGDAAVAAEHGADLVEYRVDYFAEPSQVPGLVRRSPLPCIVTCRAPREGGEVAELTDAQRIEVLNSAVTANPAYIDVELETYQAANTKLTTGGRVILSAHDFKGRPDRLYKIIAEMNASAGDVNKVVWMARSVRDNIEAFELLLHRKKPTIAMCMGEAGLIGRVLAKKFGAFLTFASRANGAETAPGQVSIEDMKRLYRWDAIGPGTRVYGVVGSPVMHSMSPAIHNAAFEQVGHDGVYLPLLVNEGYESFKAFMESFLAFEPLHFSGVSVTIPHKENALRYLKEKGGQVDPLAESIGAVNTIVIEGAKLKGFSTDYSAILDSITSALNITRDDLADYRVAVIGAGGTGRTAVAALAHCGATVVVYNRTKERADALAREFDGKGGKVVAARMEKLCDSCCHIYINTTSVGMHPNVEASPLGERAPAFGPDSLVFDTIYNPMETKLLRQARGCGAKTISGVEMFVRQAAGQFEAWTGRPAPSVLMRQVVESRLRS